MYELECLDTVARGHKCQQIYTESKSGRLCCVKSRVGASECEMLNHVGVLANLTGLVEPLRV